jgi:hypothetical protein
VPTSIWAASFLRSVFTSEVDLLMDTNKISDLGQDREILNSCRKSLRQSCLDHPRLKIY